MLTYSDLRSKLLPLFYYPTKNMKHSLIVIDSSIQVIESLFPTINVQRFNGFLTRNDCFWLEILNISDKENSKPLCYV